MGRRRDRLGIELPRRDRSPRSPAISPAMPIPITPRHSALGHRVSLRAAGIAVSEKRAGRNARIGRRSPRWAFCFFGVFFVLYNIAMTYTTAARGSLALATLPLHTMVVGALLGIEPLSLRKIGRRRHRRARRHRRGWRPDCRARRPGGVARRADHDRRRAVHGVSTMSGRVRSSSAPARLGFLTVGMGTGAAALISGRVR